MCELIRAIMINKDDIFMQYDKIRLWKIIQSHAQINIFFFLISKKIILKNHKKTKPAHRVQRGEQKRKKKRKEKKQEHKETNKD